MGELGSEGIWMMTNVEMNGVPQFARVHHFDLKIRTNSAQSNADKH
jgi:hypothetical protein